MIYITLDVSNRLISFFDEINEIIPYEMRSLVEQLRTQINKLQCEEGLLTEVIVLLQEYYDSYEDKSVLENHSKKQLKDDVNEAICNLLIALHQIRNQEIQIQNNKIRR